MSAIAELIRQADEWLRSETNAATGLAEAVARARLDEVRSPDEALATVRTLLADHETALAAAQGRVRQLDDMVEQLTRALPFLKEGWPQQRDRLRGAFCGNQEDGLADWLNYWFGAASSRRLGTLQRLQSEVPLPDDQAVIGERLAVVARALDKNDWLPCQEVLLLGAAGVRVGNRQVPDRPVPDGREPDQRVREDLRLLAVRLALHNGLPDRADAVLDMDAAETAPRLALRSHSARLRGADGEAASLLAQAQVLDLRDLDVTVESIARARQRLDRAGALDTAREAVEVLPSLGDVEGDIGRLVDPPAEIWVALAERARDEDDSDGAQRFLDCATAAVAWNDNEVLAAAEEVRATVAASAGERRRASLLAGHWCAAAGQLDSARRNYQAASDIEPSTDPADAQVRAAAQLRLADVIAVTARQRPDAAVAEELEHALRLVQEARPRPSRTSSWSYLIESDLRAQLSKVPGRPDRCRQEWSALLAAAQAVSFRFAWAHSWLALADAAMTRDLYLVAEAAAARAYQVEQTEATQAGYVRALVNTGRYDDALEYLGEADDPGNPDSPWRQCIRGLIALRLGRADQAVGHFTGLRIDPTWLWAWQPYLRALVIMGDVAAARRKSAELMEARIGRKDERSWLAVTAFDAQLNGRIDAACDIAERLSQAAGPDDVKAKRARAEAQILGGDQDAWKLLARALDADLRPTVIDVWEREDFPVLKALAAEHEVKLTPAHLDLVLTRLRARQHAWDLAAELDLAAGTAAVAEAGTAARLTKAALRAISGTLDPELEKLLETLANEDHLPTEVASLRHYIATANEEDDDAAEAADGNGAVPAPERPTMQLRLPASWLAGTAIQGADPQLRNLLAWARQRMGLSGAEELEPDRYQLLVGDEVQASGHAVLGPQPTALAGGEHELAALLTWPGAELIAARYYEQPKPGPLPLTLHALAHRCWELRGKPPDSDMPDWDTAKRVLRQFIAEDAYFLWKKRGAPLFRDPLADWSKAERRIGGTGTGTGIVPDAVVDQRLRFQIALQDAYSKWEKRGRPFGSPQADWPPS